MLLPRAALCAISRDSIGAQRQRAANERWLGSGDERTRRGNIALGPPYRQSRSHTQQRPSRQRSHAPAPNQQHPASRRIAATSQQRAQRARSHAATITTVTRVFRYEALAGGVSRLIRDETRKSRKVILRNLCTLGEFRVGAAAADSRNDRAF